MAPRGKASKAKKSKEADTKPDSDEVEVSVTKTANSVRKAKADASDEKRQRRPKKGRNVRGAAKASSRRAVKGSDTDHAALMTSSSENDEEIVSDSQATSSGTSKNLASKRGGRKRKESSEEEEAAIPQEAVQHDVSDESESDVNEENGKGDVASPPKKRGRQAENKSADEPSKKKAKVDVTSTKGDSKPKLNKATSDFEDIKFDCAAQTKDGKDWNFKISTWNVAGLKAWVKKNGLDFIKHENPDIICLQETKCSEKKLPSEAKVAGYHTHWLSGEKEGYAGIALLSKEKPINVKYGLGNKDFDSEGRLITAEFEKFYLVSVYVPNAGQKLKTLPRRMDWDPLFRAHLKKLDEKKPVILCGDLNVAHNEIDLANPKTNTRSAGFTQEERDGFSALLKEGFVDTFRHLYPDKTGAYTFWTYLSNARARNTGWRLDYFVLSERLLPSVCDNVMRNEVYGSDHCPITLFIRI